VYLGATVAVLGLAIYLTSFGPVFGSLAATPTIFLIITPVLAGLLAGVSLLPNQDDRSAIAAVLAVLGFLLLILVVLDEGSSIEWAFYPYIVFSVLQVIAAAGKLLLDAGVITAPTPGPVELLAYGHHGRGAVLRPAVLRRWTWPAAAAGYPRSTADRRRPEHGRFSRPRQAECPANGPHNGPPTPPGFPAFGQPQSGQQSSQLAGAGPSQSQQPYESQQLHQATQQAPQHRLLRCHNHSGVRATSACS
jgi:hypothetical protein